MRVNIYNETCARKTRTAHAWLKKRRGQMHLQDETLVLSLEPLDGILL